MRVPFAIAALMLLAGCGDGGVTATTNMVDTATTVAAPDAASGARYACADGRKVRAVFTDPDTLTLHIDDRPVAMQATAGTGGARYVGNGWQWQTRGLQQATLTPPAAGQNGRGAAATSCRTI